VLGVRFLALITVIVALLAARTVVGTDAPSSDRAELPSGGDGDDDGDGSDAIDLALPPGTSLTAVVFEPRRLVVEMERAPATSPFTAPIFRPPISVLA
jgi:hypothetical protein